MDQLRAQQQQEQLTWHADVHDRRIVEFCAKVQAHHEGFLLDPRLAQDGGKCRKRMLQDMARTDVHFGHHEEYGHLQGQRNPQMLLAHPHDACATIAATNVALLMPRDMDASANENHSPQQ